MQPIKINHVYSTNYIKHWILKKVSGVHMFDFNRLLSNLSTNFQK